MGLISRVSSRTYRLQCRKMYRRLFKIKHKRKFIIRNHATYNYSKPPPGSENNNNTGKSAKTLADINFNVDRIAVSLKNSNNEDNNAESKSEVQKENQYLGDLINIPHFDEIDFDYLEIALNQECVKSWHHEVLRKNELEYYGKIIDGERYVSTHGHWKQPIKSCILDLIEPSIVVSKDQSHVYQVIKMVSFEPE